MLAQVYISDLTDPVQLLTSLMEYFILKCANNILEPRKICGKKGSFLKAHRVLILIIHILDRPQMVKVFIECIQPKDKSFFNFYIFFLHGIIEPKQLFAKSYT